MNKFSKFADYEIKTQKQAAFWYTNNEQSEKGITKTIPFIISFEEKST